MFNMKHIFLRHDPELKNVPVDLEGFDDKVWGLLRRGPEDEVHTQMYSDFFDEWGFTTKRLRARALDFGR